MTSKWHLLFFSAAIIALGLDAWTLSTMRWGLPDLVLYALSCLLLILMLYTLAATGLWFRFVARGQTGGRQIQNMRQNAGVNVSNVDIVPTIVGFFGIRNLNAVLLSQFAGDSLLTPVECDRPIFQMNNNAISNYRIFTTFGLVKGDWKYLFIRDGYGVREEYYDLSSDPEEKRNLEAAYPRELETRLREIPAFESGDDLFRRSRWESDGGRKANGWF